MDEAIRCAKGIDKLDYKIEALAPIAKALAESGKVDELNNYLARLSTWRIQLMIPRKDDLLSL